MPLFTSMQALALPAPPLPSVPEDVRAVLSPDDLVLAFKTGELTGDGTKGLVVAVYPGARYVEEPRHVGKNPCKLIVFTDHAGTWKETARSDSAVDCVNNPYMSRPTEMMGIYDLEVAAGTIRWANATHRQHHTFEFTYDGNKKRWLVHAMSQGFAVPQSPAPDALMGSAHGEIVSPRDFPVTPMENLDPDRLWPLLVKHTTKKF
jgi:hypothetical protein